MKKVILTVAAVFAFGFANAQEEATEGGFSKGDIFISGAVGFESSKQGDVKDNFFEVAPRVGFFVTENIAIGGKLGFSSEKGENGDVDTIDESTFTVGAFGRYYFTPASKFSLFGELGVDYNSTDDKLADEKIDGFDVALSPGISYFVSSNFAIEATWGALSYETTESDAEGAEARNTFGLNVDLRSINFGLIYKF